jgi:hypothetical protein
MLALKHEFTPGSSWRRISLAMAHQLASSGVSRLANRSSELEGTLAVRKSAIQLGLLDSEQDFLKTGARAKAHSLQVISCYKPGRANLLGRGFGQKVADEFVSV